MAVHIPKKQGGRKRERPMDEKLAELYAEKSAAEIARMYGVSVRTVGNWVADVRRKEREEAEREAQREIPDWITVVKASCPSKLGAVLKVTPEDGQPYYIVIGATPDDTKARGSAQRVDTMEEALKKYELVMRSRSEV